MKAFSLGSKCFDSSLKTDQAVAASADPGSSRQLKTAPQASDSMPRWVRYHALSFSGSFALKKMPPMPVTRFICDVPPLKSGQDELCPTLIRAMPAECIGAPSACAIDKRNPCC